MNPPVTGMIDEEQDVSYHDGRPINYLKPSALPQVEERRPENSNMLNHNSNEEEEDGNSRNECVGVATSGSNITQGVA